MCLLTYPESLFLADFSLECKQGSVSQHKFLQSKTLASLVYFPVLEYLSFLPVEKTLYDLTLTAHPVGDGPCFLPTPSRHRVMQRCHQVMADEVVMLYNRL